MERQRGFVIATGAILSVVFLFLVVGPAVDRGGVQELLIIAAIFAAILLVERYLRTRS